MDTLKCYDKYNNKALKSNNCNCNINTNEYYRIYRQNNKDKIELKNRKYRDTNPNYIINYYKQNIEILREKKKVYYLKRKGI